MTKSNFPTIDEAFLRAAESCPKLTRELFLEQVRDHIADGSLRATGFQFWRKWRPVHIGYYGDDWGINDSFTSPSRSEIHPLAMADYWPVFADGENEACRVVRDPRTVHEPHESYPGGGPVAITKTDGWTDVRFRADDVEKLWANAAAVQHRRGPEPTVFESIKTKMKAYDPIELSGMKVAQMAATFEASADTCRRAREAVLPSKK